MCCDADGPEAFRRIERRARKMHRCCECKGLIRPGERYEYCSGVWDGEGASFKTCLDCSEIRQHDLLECAPCFGELHEAIGECYWLWWPEQYLYGRLVPRPPGWSHEPERQELRSARARMLRRGRAAKRNPWNEDQAGQRQAALT
jgi:hypothetical protein